MSEQAATPEGLDKWTVWDPDAENAHHFESRGDADARKETAEADFGIDAEIYSPGELPDALYHPTHEPPEDDAEPEPEAEDAAGEDEPMDVELIDHSPDADGSEPEAVEATPVPTEEVDSPAPDFANGLDISKDPLKVLPGWMTTQVSYSDRGDSSTTVNKRGCQVIAEYLGLDPEIHAVKRAHETDFDFATYRCTVTKPDGRTFEGTGTARADSADQGEDAGWKLDMMAETRAYKRAVKAATGGGIEAFAKEQAQE